MEMDAARAAKQRLAIPVLDFRAHALYNVAMGFYLEAKFAMTTISFLEMDAFLIAQLLSLDTLALGPLVRQLAQMVKLPQMRIATTTQTMELAVPLDAQLDQLPVGLVRGRILQFVLSYVGMELTTILEASSNATTAI